MVHLMQEAYTPIPRQKRKEADLSIYTRGTESEWRATEPWKILRRKELEVLQLGIEEAMKSEVTLLRSAE